jgi:ABC-type glutathione transport system ATPase component
MLQRAMIAMAIACEPALLIADEPTTALDVTIQAQILDLLGDLQRETGMAIILITHDLGVVARMADDVAVMYAGEIVEQGTGRRHLLPLGPSVHARAEGAMPSNDPTNEHRLLPIEGSPPDLFHPPAGCAYCGALPPRHARVCERHRPRFESGSLRPLLAAPRRRAAGRSASRADAPQRRHRMSDSPLVVAAGSPSTSSRPRPAVHAVDGVSLTIGERRSSAWWARAAPASRPSARR